MFKEQQSLKQFKWEVDQLIHLPTQNYPERKFKLKKVIGQGAEGIVYLAESINWINDIKVAIKIHNNQQMDAYIKLIDSLISQQNNNENILSSFSYHVNIIRIYEKFYINQFQLGIIMELGSLDLYEFLKQNRNINIQIIGNYCIQMARSVQYLHQNGLFHRDLKPENFMIVGQFIKLIDFGLIKNNSDRYKTIKVGSTIFQAPEVFFGSNDYTPAVDIWSLGCVFYEMITQEPLFNTQIIQEHQKLISNHLTDQKYVNDKINLLQISDTWKQILIQMLQPSPNERPKIQDVIQKIEKNNISNSFTNIALTNNFQQNNFPIKNPNFTFQPILQQIQNLIQGLQIPFTLNSLKQNFQSKQEIEKLIQILQDILTNHFPLTMAVEPQKTDRKKNIVQFNIEQQIGLPLKLSVQNVNSYQVGTDFDLSRQFEISEKLTKQQQKVEEIQDQKSNRINLDDKIEQVSDFVVQMIKDQVFQDQKIQMLRLELKDKIELVAKLIDEIQNDSKFQTQKTYFVQIIEMKCKIETMKKEWQNMDQQQLDIKVLQNEINLLNDKLNNYGKDKQKYYEIESEKLTLTKLEQIEKNYKNKQIQTKNQITTNTVSKKESDIKSQQDQILNLQLDIKKQEFLENIYQQNKITIDQLQDSLKQKENYEQRINEQYKQVIYLEAKQITYQELQSDSKTLEEKISKLSQEKLDLIEKQLSNLENQQKHKELESQVNSLKQEISQLNNLNYPRSIKTLEGEILKYRKQIEQIENQIILMNQLTTEKESLEEKQKSLEQQKEKQEKNSEQNPLKMQNQKSFLKKS